MDKLNISILYWEDRSKKEPEHDWVVEQIAEALKEGGHTPSFIGINSDLRELLDKLDKLAPDLVFNICERFADNDRNEMNVAAVLGMLGYPFTGTGAGALSLRQDKSLTKKLLKFHGVKFPNFATFDKDKLEFAGNMRFPLFVKPLHGDASIGIDEGSLVTEYSKLVERINYIQKELKSPALVEEYIEGREFYVGVLGNDPAEALPVMEFDFSNLPAGRSRINTEAAKLDPKSPEFSKVDAVVATDLTPEIRARIMAAGREAAYALGTRDYARIDLRVSAEGVPMVVEVNANPHLDRTGAFPLAAQQSGMDYDTLINRIVELAWARSKPKRRKPDENEAKELKAKAKKEIEAVAKAEPAKKSNGAAKKKAA